MTAPTRPTNDDIRAQIIAGIVNPAVVNTRELIREVVAQRDALIAAGGAL